MTAPDRRDTLAEVVARVRSLELQVTTLRRSIDAESLPITDRQYLSRCFDLLDMELGALRQYLNGMASVAG